MDKTSIQVNQQVGGVKDGARVTGVEITIPPFFKAAPAHLRRTFDALMWDKLRGFVGRQIASDAMEGFLDSPNLGYLEADSEGNLRDITTHIGNYLQREKMQSRLEVWGVITDQFMTGLRQKSQGNSCTSTMCCRQSSLPNPSCQFP
jgi:hypothetical protein